MQCPRCSTTIPAGTSACPSCGLPVGPPTAAPVAAGAVPWGRSALVTSGSGPGSAWASEPPPFPPRLPPAEQLSAGPPGGASPPDDDRESSVGPILLALGAAVLVALVVVTVVVYATRPTPAVSAPPTTASATTTSLPTTTSSSTPPTTAPPTTAAPPSTPPTSSTTTAPADGWVTWSAPDGTFTLRFPVQPTVSKLPRSDVFKSAKDGLQVEARTKTGTYAATSVGTGGLIDGGNLQAIADDIGSTLGPGTDVGPIRSTTVDGRSAVRFTASRRAAEADYLAVVEGDDLVVLAVSDQGDAERFFDSLTFT